jgi:hypothetical protein
MIVAMALPTATTVAEYLVCVFIGALEVAILWHIFDGTIDLSRLISEPTGDASMARFQFLIFTFVISLSLFLVIVSAENGPAFPASIPGGILTLLGISGSSYAVGKAIQFSDPAGVTEQSVTVTISPTDAVVRYGQTQQFAATVARDPNAKVRWEVTPGRGEINADTGLYKAPNAPAPAPTTPQHATIKVTCVDYPGVSDVAVITLT